jgi:hypothetical protein
LDLNYVQKQEYGEDLEASFVWAKSRMFDETECKAEFEKVKKAIEKGEASVTKVTFS